MVDLVINGGSQTLDGTKYYDNVTITNGGILYVTPYNGTGTTGTLILNVTYDINVDTTSSINGNSRGYRGGSQSGWGGAWGGEGPGGGGGGVGPVCDAETEYSGGGAGAGSYGTVGGSGGWGEPGVSPGGGGSIYGTNSGWDIDMGSGSGGGGRGGCENNGTTGNPAGAMLRINAKNITIRGTLNFNGGVGGNGGWGIPEYGGGGGGASGGGILLNASNMLDISSATITAIGGDGGTGYNPGGPGGGGRIKFFYTNSFVSTNATVSAGTIYYEVIGGSASFISSPPGARIWIDDIDKGVDTPNTISNLSVGIHTYKLVSGIYTATGNFTIIAGTTIDVSATIAVRAIFMTLNTNTCVDPCQVTVTTTWANDGNTSITFRPAITIDTVPIQATADITIATGGVSTPVEIVTPTLSAATYDICPFPN
jgi:hypothetical protein